MQKHFIGGQWVAGSEGRTLPVIDPSTGEAFDQLARGSAADIKRAVTAARAAPWGPHDSDRARPDPDRDVRLDSRAPRATRDSRRETPANPSPKRALISRSPRGSARKPAPH